MVMSAQIFVNKAISLMRNKSFKQHIEKQNKAQYAITSCRLKMFAQLFYSYYHFLEFIYFHLDKEVDNLTIKPILFLKRIL